jgi:tetratricopeptide (TPR) repeat protein
MATFYSDSASSKSYQTQWSEYLQTQSHIGDIKGALKEQSKEIDRNIVNLSAQQSQVLQASINEVCGTLESGFELLSGDLQNISYELGEMRSEINAMSSMLDWKLSMLIEQQRISNLLMGNIALLLKIPDYQKERHDYIEKGLNFLKKTITDSDLFENSLGYLTRALAKEPEDYFVLHRIGLIYLYSPKHNNVVEAEKFFRQAAKYAIAETYSDAPVTHSILSYDLNRSIAEQAPTNESVRVQAAESYMFIGRCCYIQRKFDEAAKNAGKAYELVPQMVEAGFNQAKSLAADNKIAYAVSVLENVINTDRYYSVKTLADHDLCSKVEVKNLLGKLNYDAEVKAYSILLLCKQKLVKGGICSDYYNRVDGLLKKLTYLTAKKSMDLLDAEREWDFNNSIYSPRLKRLINMCNSIRKFDLSVFEKAVIRINEKSQWIFPSVSTINQSKSPELWEHLIKTKPCHATLQGAINKEWQYENDFDTLINELKISSEKCETIHLQNVQRENKAEEIKLVKNVILTLVIVILVILFFSWLSTLTGWEIFFVCVIGFFVVGGIISLLDG